MVNSHFAPHAGAWIETFDDVVFPTLKPSHLTQVRGLKQVFHPYPPKNQFAPHAGAWIETGGSRPSVIAMDSHLTQVRGLKLWARLLMAEAKLSHLTQVRGLKPLS